MVSTAGPFRRSTSERSPLSATPWICKVRVRVSGLYCSVITRSTAPEVGSTCTRPPRTSFGEPGKGVAVIGSIERLGQVDGRQRQDLLARHFRELRRRTKVRLPRRRDRRRVFAALDDLQQRLDGGG